MSVKSLPKEEDRTASTVLGALRSFAELHLLFPMQQAIVFLTIVKRGEITLKDLAKELDLAPSTASRLVIDLSDTPNHGKWGLVTVRPAPDDLRARVITLTPKGRQFASRALAQ
jgi:DNA-binding MarR family transcriptional regulator